MTHRLYNVNTRSAYQTDGVDGHPHRHRTRIADRLRAWRPRSQRRRAGRTQRRRLANRLRRLHHPPRAGCQHAARGRLAHRARDRDRPGHSAAPQPIDRPAQRPCGARRSHVGDQDHRSLRQCHRRRRRPPGTALPPRAGTEISPARQQTPRRSSSRAIRFLEPAISSARVPGQRFRQESPQVGGGGLAVRYDDHLTELDRHESRHLAQSSWFLTYPKDQRQISYKSMS